MKIIIALYGVDAAGNKKAEPEFRLESQGENFTPAQVWRAGERYGQVAHRVQGLQGHLVEAADGAEIHLIEPGFGQLREGDASLIEAEAQQVLNEFDGV